MVSPIAQTATAPGEGPRRSYNFAERVLVAALKNALVRFGEEPAHWATMLGFLDAEERTIVRGVFEARPVTIRHGYAHTADAFPVVGVTLGSETTKQGLIGDVIGLEGGVITEGEVREQRLDLTIYAESPDLALYLYHWTNYAMQAHVQWFESQGLASPKFDAGGEIAPDPRYLPANLYLRRATWSVWGEASAAIPMQPPPRRVYAHGETVAVDGHMGGVSISIPQDK